MGILTRNKVETTPESPKFDLPAVKAALEFGVNQFKAFKSAHEVISILESWDNASEEIKKRLDDLNSVYSTTLQQVEDAKAELEMARKEVYDVRALALEDADKVRAEAVINAEAEKKAILAPVEAEADALHVAIAELGETKQGLESEVAQLLEKKAELEQYLAKVKESLA